MAVTSEESVEGSSEPEGMSLTKLLRPLGDRKESVRPFVPWIGGPRLYMLLLYAAVVIGSAVTFFMSQEIWYGNWEVYNTYVFAVSGVFLIFGLILLFNVEPVVTDKGRSTLLPLPRSVLGQIGLLLTVACLVGLVAIGDSAEGWAVLLSVGVVAGFVMIVMASKAIDEKDSIILALFGAGMVLMLLMPVHEAFDIARSPAGEYPFTALNVTLFTGGMIMAVLALQQMRTRDGLFAAWLLGAMALFLVSFHEQVGLIASHNAEQYDRAVAMIGITFSFVPLVTYVWRESQYLALWSRLRTANSLIRKANFVAALKHADAALEQCFDLGISRRFALPWSLRGDALYGLREHSKAKHAYEAALDIDPNDGISWCQLGNIQALDGKRALALSAYDKALKIDPNNAYAWNNKGVIFVSLAWPEEAMVCFNKAMLLMPNNFDAHINLAKISAKLGRHDEAVMHFQQALEINPDSEVAKNGLHKEFLMGQRIDQIRGWEQLGLDTRPLWALLREDPASFDRRSKEFLSSIVDQRTQLTVGIGKEKLNVNDAIKLILNVTEKSGATMEKIEKETGLSRDQLVLPMALLMKTDRLHFKQTGDKDIYVSKGKAPDKPATPPPQRRKAERPKKKEEDEKPAKKKRRFSRKKDREEDEDLEPTASVLVFGRRKKR
ncbi:TPA: tetratricopeptide repeat protein [Thermoplasmata archaeon]|nr:tetratricopeptide repeat protein [Thermoplasmata archaeon]